MSKSCIFKGLVVMGCSFLLTLPVRADIFTISPESMSDGDSSNPFDITGGFFGFQNAPTGSFWGALILFTAGAGTNNIALAPGNSVDIVYSVTDSLAAPTASTPCNVVGVGVASGMTPPTTISNPNFAPGVTTAITCQFVNNPFPPTGAASTGYFALLSLTGPGQLSAGTSTNSLGVTSIDPATLDFLSSSPFTSTSAVPEPATLGAALLGFAGLALARRRMSRANRP